MAAPRITSKHISDEQYKKSLIGRALVPFYDGAPAMLEERVSTTISARRWNHELGYFEKESTLAADISEAGAAEGPRPVGKKSKKQQPVPVSPAEARVSRSGSADPALQRSNRHAAVEPGAPATLAAGRPTSSKKAKPPVLASSLVASGAGAAAPKMYAWSAFQAAPAADALPLPASSAPAAGGRRKAAGRPPGRSFDDSDVGTASGSLRELSLHHAHPAHAAPLVRRETSDASNTSGGGWVGFGDEFSVDSGSVLSGGAGGGRGGGGARRSGGAAKGAPPSDAAPAGAGGGQAVKSAPKNGRVAAAAAAAAVGSEPAPPASGAASSGAARLHELFSSAAERAGGTLPLGLPPGSPAAAPVPRTGADLLSMLRASAPAPALQHPAADGPPALPASDVTLTRTLVKQSSAPAAPLRPAGGVDASAAPAGGAAPASAGIVAAAAAAPAAPSVHAPGLPAGGGYTAAAEPASTAAPTAAMAGGGGGSFSHLPSQQQQQAFMFMMMQQQHMQAAAAAAAAGYGPMSPFAGVHPGAAMAMPGHPFVFPGFGAAAGPGFFPHPFPHGAVAWSGPAAPVAVAAPSETPQSHAPSPAAAASAHPASYAAAAAAGAGAGAADPLAAPLAVTAAPTLTAGSSGTGPSTPLQQQHQQVAGSGPAATAVAAPTAVGAAARATASVAPLTPAQLTQSASARALASPATPAPTAVAPAPVAAAAAAPRSAVKAPAAAATSTSSPGTSAPRAMLRLAPSQTVRKATSSGGAAAAAAAMTPSVAAPSK